jgi:restriction endonuclease S subunit
VIPYILEKIDLLIARTGTTFGKMLYLDSVEPSIFASYLIRVKPTKNIIIPKFIWLFSRTSDYWKQAWNLMTNSGQQQFNANKIKRIKIPLPPIETQQKIVEKLSAIQEYKKKLLEQKQKLQELFESVLNKSFKCELAE